jgi:hypothetical protein
MKNKTITYELKRAIDFLTLLGLLLFVVFFVESMIDVVSSFQTEVFSGAVAKLSLPFN